MDELLIIGFFLIAMCGSAQAAFNEKVKLKPCDIQPLGCTVQLEDEEKDVVLQCLTENALKLTGCEVLFTTTMVECKKDERFAVLSCKN